MTTSGPENRDRGPDRRQFAPDRSRAPSESQRDGSSGGKQMKAENETVQSSKGDAKPPHKQTPAEAEAVKAYLAAQEKQGPPFDHREHEISSAFRGFTFLAHVDELTDQTVVEIEICRSEGAHERHCSDCTVGMVDADLGRVLSRHGHLQPVHGAAALWQGLTSSVGRVRSAGVDRRWRGKKVPHCDAVR
jgi:hypothetical protein